MSAVASHNGTGHLPEQADEVPAGGMYEWFESRIPRVREELGLLDRMRRQADQEYTREKERLARIHKDRVADIDGKKRRLTKLLGIFGEELPRPTPKAKRKGPTISHQTVLTVLERILLRDDDTFFTILEILDEVSYSEPQVRYAFEFLRQQEVVGKQGQENKPNGRHVYGFMPGGRESAERLQTELKAGGRPDGPKSYGVSKQRMQWAAGAIIAVQNRTGEAVSARQACDELAIGNNSEGTVRDAIRALEGIGYLKQEGQRREGRATIPSKLYVVANPAALEAVNG